jgi:phage terminase small subunit
MAAEELSKLAKDYYELAGAADVLTTLREEFEQWVEEAQDESKQEALENVLGHVENMETQYKKRRDEAQRRLETKG